MTTLTVNPYLEGNFAPARTEITADELTVIGELPPDLSGMFVRNGPNPQFPPLAVQSQDGCYAGRTVR